jgi:hypothetical protein
MVNYKKPDTRTPPKSKTEMREMLAEAVRNTQPQPEPKRRRKGRKD